MKDKLTNNIGLKVLSILLATILWLVITNIEDPVGTKTFDNVPVTILHEDVISDLGKVYDIIQGETISFTVEARRSIREALKASDFKVEADFNELSDVYAVPIEVTSPRYGDSVVVKDMNEKIMIVSLEELVQETFKVNIVQKGDIAEEYFVGAKIATPNIITVSGPKARVDRIKEVIVEVDATGATASFNAVGQPKLIDEEGNEMDNSYFDFNESYVSVRIDLYRTKEINLQILATGKPADGYAMTNIEYEPKTITVAGKNEDLQRLRYLQVKHSIGGATSNISEEINIQEKLSEGIVLVGEDQTAAINITIEKMITKDIMIWPGDVDFRNKSSAHNLQINTAGSMTVTVTGPAAELENITRMTLKPYVDIAEKGSGSYTETLKFNDLYEHSKVSISPEISFNLTPIG
ncbi:MAG TPA: hypothetical protein GXZ21_06705 [Clostridiales bacterium]|nr:hypothetical protein [Clostridiales bacterium]